MDFSLILSLGCPETYNHFGNIGRLCYSADLDLLPVHGVSGAKSRPDRPANSAGESQWLGFGMNTAWQLTDRIVLFGNIGFAGATVS